MVFKICFIQCDIAHIFSRPFSWVHRKEKWDSSGGNEVLGRVSASIPQGTKDYIGSASQNLFNRQHLRSITVFFGMGEERPFYIEKAPSLLVARLKHNVKFFYLNYMIVFAILFVLTMITSFSTMIGLVGLGAAWLYVIKASDEGTLRAGGKISKPRIDHPLTFLYY